MDLQVSYSSVASIETKHNYLPFVIIAITTLGAGLLFYKTIKYFDKNINNK